MYPENGRGGVMDRLVMDRVMIKVNTRVDIDVVREDKASGEVKSHLCKKNEIRGVM